MSTLEERVEASVWLETHRPDASPDRSRRFFASVDAYYNAHPIAYRGADLLTGLRQDTQVFTAIDAALTRGDDPDEAWAETVTAFREQEPSREQGESRLGSHHRPLRRLDGMDSLPALLADNTHLYPGATLTLPPEAPLPTRPAEAVVVFSDQERAEARLTLRTAEVLLEVEAYTTAAGNEIDAKSWLLRTDSDDRLVVTRRAA